MIGPFRARVIAFSRSQGVALGWYVAAPFGAKSNDRNNKGPAPECPASESFATPASRGWASLRGTTIRSADSAGMNPKHA
jgi:hypothetical protein